ncbi:MAG: HEAT repeat domain-containing protein [Methanomassiliicoccales archaeon]|nr:MAG: HEAT repeat domain-containing protein [Methanomassiliicoccales archaeon]
MKIGVKWIGVTLRGPRTFLGRFVTTISVPKVCCKCLNVASEEEDIEWSFSDAQQENKTWTFSLKFPYCKKCSEIIVKRSAFHTLILVPTAIIFGIILGWLFFTTEQRSTFYFVLFGGLAILLPIWLVLARIEGKAIGVKMKVSPLPPNHEYITFLFENRKYAEMFKEANKESYVSNKIKKDKDLIDILIQTLEHKDSNRRLGAAKALGKRGDARAIEPLIEATKDENKKVREAAGEAIEKIKSAQEEK